MTLPTFSIVINTLNRGASLPKTLDSLRWLRYAGEFEVVVVNGPSTDDSAAVIDAWQPRIRAGQCPVANLSVSRNIGICMAAGDIVAFIDDDAIPEPEWLTQLAAAYDADDIGGAGGLVYDQTGYHYQYQFSTANRFGNANWNAAGSAEHLCFPGSFEFPYLQGTNASFRRSALLEIGGFDEEIEYYLDEVEVCCRLVDAGYRIRQLPRAYVHHKFAPSHVRDEHRITRYRYPVIKNKIYFSLRHGREYASLPAILEDNQRFSALHERDVATHIDAGRLSATELDRFRSENERAWEVGIRQGLWSAPQRITSDARERLSGAFGAFPTVASVGMRTLVFVSGDYPPDHGGGIATFNRDLARAWARRGHCVHVVTKSSDIDRVDLEDGVWVHRLRTSSWLMPPEAVRLEVPDRIWNWSATALSEVERISSHHPIDVVEAPVWDCEGIAFILRGRWPLVTSLQTTLRFWLDSHPELERDGEWMRTFGTPMLGLESIVMQRADAVRSISRAIALEIEARYQFKFDPARLVVAHLGMDDVRASSSISAQASDDSAGRAPVLLFVGRLELRKGIDVLLDALPTILEAHPELVVRIIGDDRLLDSDGRTFPSRFAASEAGRKWQANVRFEGKVDESTLAQAYADCDLFVAPSRFESFGLIFLEAMRESKPVVGTTAGGIPEIVTDGVTGLLVRPGDPVALALALNRLLADAALRRTFGEAGRKRFEEAFLADGMVEASAPIVTAAQANHAAARQ